MKNFTIILLFVCTQFAIAFPTITEINPTINFLIQQVDIDTLEAKIRYLQDLGPRPSYIRTSGVDLYPNNIKAKN
jgi:hypothetical protein